ncbi:MAG: RnfABCDGE type electron transport complex subunit D, partial [Bacteroidetes bacterium]|nr:RnfABCDGE type electron transport complex subunit D [Bacteroidota bacterium]
MTLLTISGSPHIHGEHSVKKIMWEVVIALVPAMLASFYFFGINAILVTTTAIISCVVFEYLIYRFFFNKNEITITDGSAIITGILLAFNLPSSLPIWMVIVGSAVAIGVAKMPYGGLGKNIFNPALVGRVFLLISFPVEMTTWTLPVHNVSGIVDVISGPTVLGTIREGMMNGQSVTKIMENIPSYQNMFIGNMGGSLGEVSALALLIG